MKYIKRIDSRILFTIIIIIAQCFIIFGIPAICVQCHVVDHHSTWSNVPENALNIQIEMIQITDKRIVQSSGARYLCGLTEDGTYVEYKTTDKQEYGTAQIGDVLTRTTYDLEMTYSELILNTFLWELVFVLLIFVLVVVFHLF